MPSASAPTGRRPPRPAPWWPLITPSSIPRRGERSREVAGKVKKILRDRQGRISDADRQALALELGDVLWYLSEMCTRLGIRLEDVGRM
jgi:NTP pyrophosphatase (non-canonical NTP hydrolase)